LLVGNNVNRRGFKNSKTNWTFFPPKFEKLINSKISLKNDPDGALTYK